LRSILKVSQFAFDLIQIAVNFNVRLSQFKKKKKKTIYDGIRFPGFFQQNRFKPNRKKQKKTLYIKGLGFLILSKKTGFNRTRPVRFEPVSGPVRLIFTKNTKIQFGWFFESKLNQTVNIPMHK